MLDKCEQLLAESKQHILNLAIGGTAVEQELMHIQNLEIK